MTLYPEQREKILQAERKARAAAQPKALVIKGDIVPFLIAIDPGACTGFATFTKGILGQAGICDRNGSEYWKCVPHFARCNSLVVVVEKPVDYPGSARKADPNDLITLALHVGALKYHYELHGAKVQLVTPYAWKGQTPKDIHNARTLAALTEYERSTIPTFGKALEHNMLDAIGLGLWYLASKGARINATR